ncbi:glycosyltransferase family 2 protein, partial [Enterococcus faecium]
IHLQDTQTGLRGFSIFSLSELLKIEGNRFEYEINQLLVLPKIGYRITTIPIKTIYSDGNKGSHFRIFQDSYLVYRP